MRTAIFSKFLPPFKGSGVAPDTLLTGLEAYWPLDEQSSFRYNALDSGGLSASFVKANLERLSVADNADFSGAVGKSFTFAFWLKPDNLTGDQGVFSKGTGDAGAAIQYFLEMFSDGNLYWYVGDATTNHFVATPIAIGKWQFVVCGFDASSGKGFISIDLAAESLSLALPSGSIQDGTGDFSIGRYSLAVYTDSKMSRFGVWNKVLSGPERTELYNLGRGKKYSQLSVGIKTGLISYWNLDEASGNRADSFGLNTLTDNNTVLAVQDNPGDLLLTDNNTVTYVNDGPRGVNGSFVKANSEYLSSVSAAFDLPSGLTLGVWFKTTDATQYPWLIGYDPGVTGDPPLGLYIDNGSLGVRASDTTGFVTASIAGVNDGNWHLALAWFDSSDKKAYLQLDAGTPVASAALPTDPVLRSAVGLTFKIGQWFYGNWDGNISRAGVWSGILGAPARISLYNLGRGKSYSDLSPAEKVNLVSYWNLDESSNGAGAVTRNDSHGVNNLTDNNTVLSVNTGPESVVASFVNGSNESLSNGALVPGVGGAGTFHMAFWLYVGAATGGYIVQFEDGYVFPLTALVRFNGVSTNIELLISDNAGFTSTPTLATILGWNLVEAWITNDKIGHLAVNGMAPVDTIAALPGNPRVSTHLYIGDFPFVGDAATMRVAGLGVWSTVLNAGERAELFNSGVGKKYSELSAGIKTNLVSYWNLTELSGNRADSHGANTLTDNNTVMSVINMNDVADKICAKFASANNEYLEHIDDVRLRQASEMTWAFWFRTSTNASYQVFISKDSGAAPDREFAVYVSNTGVVYIEVYWTGVDTLTGAVVVSDGNWHLLVFWVTAAGKINCAIDDGTPIVNAGALVGPPNNGIAPFRVGLHSAGGGSYPNNGLIDELMYWKNRVLTPAERTRLFNLGKGKFYPFTP